MTAVQARFGIGDFVLELTGDGRAIAELSTAWAPFATTSAPSASIKFSVDPSRAPSPAPVMPEQVPGPDGALRLEAPSFLASVHAAHRSIELSGADERFGVDCCAKWLLAAHLARQSGLLVHGVAACRGERAALFTGPSGAGKSTLGSFAVRGGLAVLSDELVAVRPSQGGYVADGTPWNIGRPGRASLYALGTLAWAKEPRVEPQPPVDVVRVLLGNVILSDLGPAGRTAAFRAATALANAVTTVQLWFAMSPDVGEPLAKLLA